MHIDPNDLLLFARVVEAGSFSRAAERVGLPKSTVSRRVAGLEAGFGERLLTRTTRKLVLTEFGLSLLDHARQVVAEVDAVAALAEHRQAEPSGHLRVSMPGDFACLVIAPLLTEFIARYPAVVLDVDLSPRRVDLIGENFDLALRMGELPDDATLAARRVGVFSVGLYAAPAYLDRRGTPAGPDELLQHDALRLLPSHSEPLPWSLARGPERWEQVPPGRAGANSPELLVRLARLGAGIVAVPDHYAQPYVDGGELVAVLPDWRLPPVTAWAVFPGRRLMPAKTRVFIDLLEERFTRRCPPPPPGGG